MKNLSENKLKVIQKILNIYGKNRINLTGSISLNVCGVIDRPIKDIDLVVFEKQLFLDMSEDGRIDNEYEDEDSENEDEPNISYNSHRRFIMNKEEICIFYDAPQDYLQHPLGRISHPKYSIIAKRKYVKLLKPILSLDQRKRYDKNMADILAYEKWEKTLNSLG